MANLVDQILEAWRTDPTMGRDRLAKMFGLPRGHLRRPIQQAKERYRAEHGGDKPASEAWDAGKGPEDRMEFSDHGNAVLVTKIVNRRITTKDELIAALEIDSDVWDIPEWQVTKWDMGAMPRAVGKNRKWERKHTKPIITELFRVKVRIVKRPGVQEAINLIDRLQQKAERYSPPAPAVIVHDLKRTGNMAEFSLYDHHFGALIWGKETGWDDYDTSIADRVFREAVETMLARSRAYGVDSIMLSLGNDLQNADNRLGTTEAGTMQSNDSRYERVCGIVQDTAVWAVERCRQEVPRVIIPMIRGNHDPLTTFHLGGYLKAWFRNYPDVEIDNSPLQRKAYQHGKVMLMLTHGKGIKTAQYPMLMAVEYPQMWAATTWRETHTGHIHTRRNMIPELDEIAGVAVRSLPSLRPPCSWSADSGYVGNMRSADAYIWNEEEGLIGTAHYSVRSQRAAA